MIGKTWRQFENTIPSSPIIKKESLPGVFPQLEVWLMHSAALRS
jgi:hypothetical protein